jgi:hypothetical protein
MKIYIFVLIGQISGTVFWKREAKSSYKSFHNTYRSCTSTEARYVPHWLFRRVPCFVADEWDSTPTSNSEENSILRLVSVKHSNLPAFSIGSLTWWNTSVTGTVQKLRNNCCSEDLIHTTAEAWTSRMISDIYQIKWRLSIWLMGHNLISCYNAYFCFRKLQRNEEGRRKENPVPERAKKAHGEAGLVPRVMNLCSRCKCVVKFTPRPLYPPTTEILLCIEQETGWPQNQSRRFGEQKTLVFLPIKPRFLGHPTRILFTITTEISFFLILHFSTYSLLV